MRDIKVVMTTVSYENKYMKRIIEDFAPAQVIILNNTDEQGIAEALKIADVAVIPGDLDQRFIDADNLKWIHCGHAGLNKSAKKEVFEKDLIVTSSAGRSAPALAEHIIMFMLSLSFNIDRLIDAQRAHKWGIEGQNELRSLVGKTLGIIGMGNNGIELAVRAKAMGMKVLAFDTKPETPANTNKYYSTSQGQNIDELLVESDFVALCVPLTNKTHHMISGRELKMMKKTACIINMARGAVIDEKVLIQALKEGWIAGAGLDTFEQEPLSENSDLWDLSNVYITPHCTPQVPDRTGVTVDILSKNIRHYRSEEKMLNQLTQDDMYTK